MACSPNYPLTVESLRLAFALLATGGYRGVLYIGLTRKTHPKAGHPWSDELAEEFTDCSRVIFGAWAHLA